MMMKLFSFTWTFFLVMCVLNAHTQAEVFSSSAFKEKIDYITLNQPAPVKPEILQFFSFYCPHCRHFEPVMDNLRQQLPQGIAIKRIPVAFGSTRDVSELLQQSYAFAMHYQKAQPFMDYLFDEIQLTKIRPKNPKQAYDIALQQITKTMNRTNFTPQEVDLFQESIGTFGLVQDINKYNKQAKQYKVSSVPTIIVNGRYQIQHHILANPKRFQELVKYLLAKQTPYQP